MTEGPAKSDIHELSRKVAELLFAHFKPASRHVMSGAAGGLVATYSYQDTNWFAVVVLGVMFIVLVSALYRGIELADWMGMNLREKVKGGQPERIRMDWDEGRAS